MKTDKLLRIAVCMAVMIALVLLIKANVTFSKEPSSGSNLTSRVLETNSELVQNIYSKLTLLNDSLSSDNYKHAYFKMNDNEKELSVEEKLYITIENMYKNDLFDIEKIDDKKEKTKINADRVIDQARSLFKGDSIDARNINFQPASSCGIVGYLYTGTDYEFTFKKCDPKLEISRTELKSAKKEGNYVILRVKSFYASYKKKSKKEKEDQYTIHNYNSDEELLKIPSSQLKEKIELITETYPIDDYDFYFELRGEDYYLTKIVHLPV